MSAPASVYELEQMIKVLATAPIDRRLQLKRWYDRYASKLQYI